MEIVGDIMSVASVGIKESQWANLESVYKEAYLAYLDEWIESDANSKMQKAYKAVMKGIENDLNNITGFLDKSLIRLLI